MKIAQGGKNSTSAETGTRDQGLMDQGPAYHPIFMSSAKVTVLMSVYNGARYLESAVRSILDQTFRDFEFLIINDGSRDESPQILERIRDPRIRLIHTENRGLAAALERGMQEARAPYVARMDADDLALPDRLETQVAYLVRHPNVGVVDADYVHIDSQDVPIHTRQDRTLDYSVMISWKLLWQNPICHPLVMMRRELVQTTGFNYEPGCAVEDYDLWTRLLFHTRFGHIPRVLLRYRRNPVGMTGTRDRRQLSATSRIQQRTLSTLLGPSVDPLAGQSLAILSQQTAVPPSASDIILDTNSLVGLVTEVRRAFAKRFPVSPADRARIDSDLALRFLEWGLILSRVPGRARDATGVLMREALSLKPRVILDKHFSRNVLVRLLGTTTYLRLRSKGWPSGLP
jgi:hypothetical protein